MLAEIRPKTGFSSLDVPKPTVGVEFVPHDLRRTPASCMTSMGISRLVVAKILNHVESGVTAIYDRHSYDGEKRAALLTWGVKVESIVNETDEASKFARPGQ